MTKNGDWAKKSDFVWKVSEQWAMESLLCMGEHKNVHDRVKYLKPKWQILNRDRDAKK